jgi:hypothetical protein
MSREIIVRPSVELIQSAAKALRARADRLEQEALELQEDKDFLHVDIALKIMTDVHQDFQMDALLGRASNEKARQSQLEKLDLEGKLAQVTRELNALKGAC